MGETVRLGGMLLAAAVAISFDENGDDLDHYHVVKNDARTLRLIKTIRAGR